MDINALMKQAQKMQSDLANTEKELKEKMYFSSVGGEAVKVSVNGEFQVIDIDINSDLLEKENKEMLDELVQMAINNALSQATQDKKEKMSALTSGVDVPGIF